jgi:hypothetical protein
MRPFWNREYEEQGCGILRRKKKILVPKNKKENKD